MSTQGTLHLVVGPVGAGKSTWARRWAVQRGGVFLDLDTWMVRLYGKDNRPAENVIAWYLERRERCRALIWDTALEILGAGSDVLLETGLVAAGEREAFYGKVWEEGLTLHVYLVDAPRDVRRERVARRNDSQEVHVQVVPLDFFERASDAWQPPSEAERRAVSMVEI